MFSISRARMLGATATGAAFALACSTATTLAADRADPGDFKTLGESLGAELAAMKVYADAAAATVVGPTVRSVLQRFQSEHGGARDAILAAFTQAGQNAPTASAPIDPETFATELDVLSYAYALERGIAAAYLATVAPYKSRALATLAASVLGATTARVALLGEALRHGAPYPTGVVTA